MFNITGKIKVINKEQVISDKFKKREFVVTDNSSQYPQDLLFQLTQDKTNLIDSHKVGDEIKVHFNLRGREWTSPKGEVKYFVSLDAWKLEGSQTSAAPTNEAPPVTEESFLSQGGEEDDLPF